MTPRRDALAAIRLRKQFNGTPVAAGVDLAVHPGEAVGLLGRSGAGKSTVFAMLAGVLAPDSGQVVLDGADIGALGVDQRARLGIGYIPQSPQLFTELTVEQNLVIAVECRDGHRSRRELIDELLDTYGLARWRKHRLSMLSGGERRQCEIAYVMATQPRFMLLDEPFTGLDPLVSAAVTARIEAMKLQGIGVLLTDHKVREALALVDRAYIIDDGRVVAAGTPRALVADEKVRAAYLGPDFRN